MINPANPVGAFLQGNQAGQQYRAGQQQMDLQRQQNDRANRAEQRGIEASQQQRQQWLAENLPDALAYSDTPEKWDQSVAYLESLGFNEAAQFRGRFDMRGALLAQVQGSQQRTIPAGYRMNEDGSMAFIPGGPADPNRPRPPEPQTALQRDAAWYLGLSDEEQAEVDRMRRGEEGPSSQLERRLFEVNDAAFRSRSSVERYNNLADELVRVNPQGGVAGAWTERLKAITGAEDAVTLLRQQWNELRVSNAIQNLPPGVASDKDIELVMSAFLPEFANAETIASFMRGLAKMEELRADYHEFEAQYLSSRRSPVGLNEAWREFMAQRTAGQQQPGAAPPGGGQGGQQNNEQNSDPLNIRGR